MAELKEYACCEDIPTDAASVELTISYLSALNNLFERSIIGKKVRVFTVNGTTMQRMSEGFNFLLIGPEKTMTISHLWHGR